MVSISTGLLPRLNDDVGDEMSECIMIQNTTELREHSETTSPELREQTQTTNLTIRKAKRSEQLQMIMMHT